MKKAKINWGKVSTIALTCIGVAFGVMMVIAFLLDKPTTVMVDNGLNAILCIMLAFTWSGTTNKGSVSITLDGSKVKPDDKKESKV